MNFTLGRDTVAFGEGVRYVCVDGYYFDEGIEIESFDLLCHENATVTEPRAWKTCVDPTGEYSIQNSGLFLLIRTW